MRVEDDIHSKDEEYVDPNVGGENNENEVQKVNPEANNATRSYNGLRRGDATCVAITGNTGRQLQTPSPRREDGQRCRPSHNTKRDLGTQKSDRRTPGEHNHNEENLIEPKRHRLGDLGRSTEKALASTR
ncbi:hypothetical protein ACSBR1_033822 [Camellia fascicularis]